MINRAVSCKGIVCPFIRENDHLVNIVVDSIMNSGIKLQDNDVIGITESVVARSQGNYVTVDEIADEITRLYGKNPEIYVMFPIFSRNRFAMILKGIARAASRINFILTYVDEVGNVIHDHPFTGLNYDDLYRSICNLENCECSILDDVEFEYFLSHTKKCGNILYCGLHDYMDDTYKSCADNYYTLADLFKNKCEYGLYGSNKATEEKLKLFPSKRGAQQICDEIKKQIKVKTKIDVVVCCYGDGCFKDPVGGIWEFADPITMPAYTNPELIESTPNEIKLKSLIDNTKNDSDIKMALDENRGNLVGSNKSMGTTPRLYRDLLASLMDLVSGSGDRATPVVVVQNYF